MKKTIIALMLAVCMLCPVFGSAEAAPTEKTVPFFTEEGEAGEPTMPMNWQKSSISTTTKPEFSAKRTKS